MGKASVECPRCGKKVKINWDDKKPWILKNLKGANWLDRRLERGNRGTL
jgi:hypothetical protein